MHLQKKVYLLFDGKGILLMSEFPWQELPHRLDNLKRILKDHCIIPAEGYGLRYMIDETEAVVHYQKKDIRESDIVDESIKSIKGIQALST